MDSAIEIFLPIVGLFGTAMGAAALSPEVANAGGWVGVFFATLTWSLGCALAVVLMKTSRLQGWPLAVAVSLCFIASLTVASFIGSGVLDISATIDPSVPGPLRIPIAVLVAALATYGFVGTILGGGIGAWLGYRVGERIERLKA